MITRLRFLTHLLLAPSLCHGTEKVSLQLKWLHQFQSAGYYAAIEEGYYTEEGLEVELIEANSQEQPSRAVLEGRADFGVFSSELLVLRAQGEPVVALAAIYQHSPQVFASMRSSGIESIHDLAGKRIMIEPGSADLLALLIAEQIPLDTIKFQPHAFSLDPLYEGEIDALSADITDEPFAIRALGEEPVIFSPRSTGIDFYGDILFTTEAFIEQKPTVVEAFKRASLRGWSFALKNPDTVINTILEKYPTQKSRAALTYQAQRTIDLIRADIVEIGNMNPGRWQHMAEVFQSVEMIDSIPDLDAMLYQEKTPFAQQPPFKIIGISTLCISILGLITWKESRMRKRIEAETARRMESDKILSERKNEYQAMVEGAPLTLIVWDTKLNITHWNKEAEKLFGWSAHEATGRCALDLIVPAKANEKIRAGIKVLKPNASHTQINQNITKDGRLIWCRWHNVPRKNASAEVIEFHSIAIEVTADIEQQMRLEKDHASALSANKAKDQLLARTSHEIRNPLSAIMGFTQFIVEDSHDQQTKKMAQLILDGAEGMLAILNDLLDTAKIEAGKVELDLAEIDVATCIRKEAKLFSQLIEKQGLTLDISIAEDVPTIVSDARAIRQILHNLINNARKFTDSGSITVSLQSNKAASAIVRVIDTGIGMDPETMKDIFEPFVQGPKNCPSSNAGTGLGLSLTKKLVELLGGKITIESVSGKGSVVTVEIPNVPN
ncbi:MAG: PAS domain S-box-containing protein [Lentimonas sp.]|jgi:PAS domain S-box-containing protein